MTQRLVLIATFLFTGCIAAGALPARPSPCVESSQCRDVLVHKAGGIVPFFRSSPLEFNSAIERAIIVVQGNRRDADHYYDALVSAVRLEADAPHRFSNTLLLAPNFRALKDDPAPNELYWSSHGWKIGNKSRDSKRISSFAVMDDFLTRLCSKTPNLYPNLTTLVIVGHSAGGQFINRYVAGGAACGKSAVEVRYVVMNPSSYLYIDDRRKLQDGGSFGSPAPGCSKYDEYKYGLRDLNTYMKRVGERRLREQLFHRRTYYVAGSEDNRLGGALDRRCQANLQGPNRLARHAIYREYVALFDDWTGASFYTVPGVGHKGERMLQSPIVRELILH